MDVDANAITLLLQSARAGDASARDQLFSAVYDHMHALAARQLRGDGPVTMQPTALVNEACLRLLDPAALDVADRSHFFALAVTIMRRVLVDHFRRGQTERRGGAWLRVTYDEHLAGEAPTGSIDILALDAALDRLAALDERKARVVELRFFAGLGVPEVAAALQVSTRTVEADWYFARAWLRGELRNEDPN